MRNAFILIPLTLIFALPFGWNQTQPNSEKATTVLNRDSAKVTNTLESGRLLESKTKDSFFLVPRQAEGGTHNGEMWSFGKEELKPWQGLSVEVQIGEYEAKPVFLPLRVPRNEDPAQVDEAVGILIKAINDASPPFFEHLNLQRCAHGRRCVKSCKDDSGRFYCCRYECSKKKTQ